MNQFPHLQYLEKRKEIDSVSLEFQLIREDFQRWIIDILGYYTLAQRPKRLKKKNLQGEKIGTHLLKLLPHFF